MTRGDYVVNRSARPVIMVGLVVLTIVWLVAGVLVIALFDPTVPLALRST